MIQIAAFFIKYWRLFLPAGVALIIACAYIGGRFTGYQAGQKQGAIEYQAAQVKAMEAARVKIGKAGVKNDERKKIIREIKGDNPIAGPRVTSAIDSLP